MIERRLFMDLVLLVSLFVMPWWLTLLAAITFVFFFEYYIEALLIALLIDTMYGFGNTMVTGLRVPAFSSAVLVYLVSVPLKRRLIFYQPRMQ